jgi:hypothetical protein
LDGLREISVTVGTILAGVSFERPYNFSVHASSMLSVLT